MGASYTKRDEFRIVTSKGVPTWHLDPPVRTDLYQLFSKSQEILLDKSIWLLTMIRQNSVRASLAHFHPLSAFLKCRSLHVRDQLSISLWKKRLHPYWTSDTQSLLISHHSFRLARSPKNKSCRWTSGLFVLHFTSHPSKKEAILLRITK